MQTTITIKDREEEVRLIAYRLSRQSNLSEEALLARAEQIMMRLESEPVSNLLGRMIGIERLFKMDLPRERHNRLRVVG